MAVCANKACGVEFTPHNGNQRYCCHACFLAARKAYMYEFNRRPIQREKSRLHSREAYKRPEVKAKRAAYSKKWCAEHKAESLAIKDRYRKSPKGRIADAKFRASQKGIACVERYKAGPAYRASRHRRDINRRLRILNANPRQSVVGIHWTALVARTGSMKCAACGVTCIPKCKDARLWPTVDHKIALYAGGTDTWDNVQLLCMSCNARKSKRDIAYGNRLRELAKQTAALPMEDPT